MKVTILAALAAISLVGCASTSRMASYAGGERADAKYQFEGREYILWVHPKDDMVMIQRGAGTAFSKGLKRGATFGIAETGDGFQAWKQAAEYFVEPTGCKIRDVRSINTDVAWEASYVCSDGVDLRQLVQAQRLELRQGTRLRGL